MWSACEQHITYVIVAYRHYLLGDRQNGIKCGLHICECVHPSIEFDVSFRIAICVHKRVE